MKKRNNILLIGALMTTQAFASVHINEMMVRNTSYKVNENYNFEGWVELYNSGAEAVDLRNCFFSNSESNIYLWQNQSNDCRIQPKGYYIFYFDELDKNNHANFKLDSDGGTLILSDESGRVLDKVTYPKPFRNTSYGRTEDGGNTLAFFTEPSMNATNNNSTAARSQTAAPTFSKEGGFYSGNQTISIYAEDGDAKIYYTTDGKEPTIHSNQYNSPININNTTPLRAIAVVNGEVTSEVTTATYFIGVNNIPMNVKVISLVTDRDYVYGDELGAFVVGRNGSQVPSTCGSMDRTANYMNDWDRPCNFELFDEKKSSQVNQEVKISAFGACSRTKAIKSIAVKANKAHGNNKIDYNLFREKPALKWKSLVLRNSGNDFGRMLFRDGYIQTLAASGMDLDHQAYEPVVVFMNGEYYAMLGMRERTNKDFVYSNYGLKEEDFCIQTISKTGSTECDDYQIVKSLGNGDFNRIDENIDVDEFLNYLLTEIYVFNKDWADNNNKAWKRTENGKWRWILYDTEYSTSLYEENMTGNGFSNLNKVNYYNNIIQNPEMKRRLMTKFVTHAGTTFGEDNAEHVLDSMMNILSKEADYFRDFLARKNIKESSLSWKDEAMKVRNFIVARQNVVMGHVASNMQLGNPVPLRIYANIPGGSYTLNGLENIRKSDFRSQYFTNSAIQVKANAPTGYKFKNWEVRKEEYLINTNDSWKYLYLNDGVNVPSNWKDNSFEDESWQSGQAPLGSGVSYYVKTSVSGNSNNGGWNGGMFPAPGDNNGGWGGIGGGDWGGIGGGDWGGIDGGDWGGIPGFGGTTVSAKTTLLRKEFNVNSLNSMSNELQCLAHINDGAIIYLNGREVFRYNLPNYNVQDTTMALLSMDSYATVKFNIQRSYLNEGKNVIAVELHCAKGSGSLAFDMNLLDENTGVSTIQTSSNDEYSANVNGALVLKAIFEKDNNSTPYDKLYINEICAANKQYVDEFRQDEDWIEIYNDGESPVDLGGLYLSDKRKTLNRFKIPTGNPSKTTVPAKGYLVFWADADSSAQGPLHTNFELSKDKSQTISLSRMENGNIQVIDSVRYQPHTDGESYSRFSYTGDGAWSITSRPTFNKKNAYFPLLKSSTSEIQEPMAEATESLAAPQVYPNPASDYLWFSFPSEENGVVTITDMTGRVILNQTVKNGDCLNINDFERNIYMVIISVGEERYTTKIVKL